jgi:hypothetical protein
LVTLRLVNTQTQNNKDYSFERHTPFDPALSSKHLDPLADYDYYSSLQNSISITAPAACCGNWSPVQAPKFGVTSFGKTSIGLLKLPFAVIRKLPGTVNRNAFAVEDLDRLWKHRAADTPNRIRSESLHIVLHAFIAVISRSRDRALLDFHTIESICRSMLRSSP